MLMNERIANFPQQMREAITIGENAQLSASKNKIQNVLITCLGGSGIGGSVFSQIVDCLAHLLRKIGDSFVH